MNFTHEIKAWPEFYRQMESNELTVNIRNNDRGYTDGDILIVSEFEPMERTYPEWQAGRLTGRQMKRRVNRVFTDLPGLMPGYALLTLSYIVER